MLWDASVLKKCGASSDAAGISETPTCINTPPSANAAAPVPPPKQAAQLPSDLNGNAPSQPILGSNPKHAFCTTVTSFNPAWYRT